MAQPRNTGGGQPGGMRIEVHTTAQRATDDFKAVRRDANHRLREGLRIAGETVALPAAKMLAGNLAITKPDGSKISTASTLTVRARARDAILTTNIGGRLGRAVGLQEFGGDVSTPILPVAKEAVVVNGQPVASVLTTRHYEGRLFMTRAVDANRAAIDGALLDETMHAFDGFEKT